MALGKSKNTKERKELKKKRKWHGIFWVVPRVLKKTHRTVAETGEERRAMHNQSLCYSSCIRRLILGLLAQKYVLCT
jgi:hypothetical protein